MTQNMQHFGLKLTGTSWLLSCIIALFMLAQPAHATIYSYETDFPGIDGVETLTIDTQSRTATIVGDGTAITLGSPDFKNFEGGVQPDQHAYSLTAVSGWLTYRNTRFDSVSEPTDMLRFEGGGNVLLWSSWASERGETIRELRGQALSYTPPAASNARNGGDGADSGALARSVPVPAPGLLGIMGLGLLALAGWKARQRQH